MSVQLDHSYKQDDKPIYMLNKVFSLNSGSSVTLSATGTQQSVFNLSSNVVWNFARSYIQFDLTFSAVASNAVLCAVDTIPIDNVQLLTQSGSQLAALYNVQPFSRAVPSLSTKLTDYLSRGPVISAPTKDGTMYSNNVCLQPSNGLISAQPAALIPTDSYVLSVSGAYTTQAIGPSVISAQGGSDKDLMSRQRIAWGAINQINVLSYKIPLKSFNGTILGMDKDYVFNQNLQLVVNWSAVNQFAEMSTAITQKGAVDTFTPVASAASFSGTTTISNLYLLAAKQINSNLVNRSMANLMAGYTVNIPFVQCGKNTSNASGLYSAVQIVSANAGRCLKRIVNIVVSPTSTLLFQTMNDNVDGKLYTTCQSQLDANFLQPNQLATGNGSDDYEWLYDCIKSSPSGLSLREFQINSFFVDNFSSNSLNSNEWCDNDDVDDGLVINNSKNYNFQVTLTQSGANIYQYIVYLRSLRIDSTGVNWI